MILQVGPNTQQDGAMTVVQIPKDRYISAEFAAVEASRLWPNVWQFACSADHVSAPGDYYEHRVGTLSVLIVRGDDGVLRAFQNVCLHRGAELCSGAGSGLASLQCPFHRWTWALDGSLREIPSRKQFGILNDALPLIGADVETWGPFVFVRPARSGVGSDLEAATMDLAAFLDPVPNDCAWVDVDAFRCTAAVTVEAHCNWKTLIEGFSETYHVQGIHREMLAMCDDVCGPQIIWDRHGKLRQSYGLASPRVGTALDAQCIWEGFVEVMGARVGINDLTEAGAAPSVDIAGLRPAIAERIRAKGADRGVDYSRFDDAQMLDMHQYNLFPNITVLVFADMINVVRARPHENGDPNFAYIDMFNFERRADADAGASSPTRPIDVTLDPEQGPMLGLVLSQDLANFARSQRGLHQPGFTHLTVSDSEECRIVNLHRNLEQWCGAI